MNVEQSFLILEDTSLINFTLKFIPVVGGMKLNSRDIFAEYDLDMDFAVNKNGGEITVFIKADINKEESKPGYKIFAECGCIFKYAANNNLTIDQKKSLEGYSVVYIALNTLRSYITNITANAPIGKYILPSIDLNKLIESKVKSVKIPEEVSKQIRGKKLLEPKPRRQRSKK